MPGVMPRAGAGSGLWLPSLLLVLLVLLLLVPLLLLMRLLLMLRSRLCMQFLSLLWVLLWLLWLRLPVLQGLLPSLLPSSLLLGLPLFNKPEAGGMELLQPPFVFQPPLPIPPLFVLSLEALHMTSPLSVQLSWVHRLRLRRLLRLRLRLRWHRGARGRRQLAEALLLSGRLAQPQGRCVPLA